jgi:glycosyltransferase involved in cell wall biosynthesis
MYKYDIIFPFYKDYKFLDQCLYNINKQQVPPKNLIFVDDGNKNKNLKKIIEKKLRKKINLIFVRNFLNLKTENAVLKGVKFIKSDFFYMQGCDDIHYPNFAKENLCHLSKFKKAAFSFSNPIINDLNLKRKIFLEYNFMKSQYHKSNQMKKIYYHNQFKIYNNTVMFRSYIFKKNNLFNPIFSPSSDMINLIYLAYKFGAVYIKKNLSEFTIRDKQFGSRILLDKTLMLHLKYLKNFDEDFFNFYIKSGLHFDLSIFSIFKYFILLKKIPFFNLKWMYRSIKFRLWKKVRFVLPTKLLKFIYKYLG